MGMTVGDERAITTQVGDTWWEPDTLRGVGIRADIKLKELFEWELPEVHPCLIPLRSRLGHRKQDSQILEM